MKPTAVLAGKRYKLDPETTYRNVSAQLHDAFEDLYGELPHFSALDSYLEEFVYSSDKEDRILEVKIPNDFFVKDKAGLEKVLKELQDGPFAQIMEAVAKERRLWQHLSARIKAEVHAPDNGKVTKRMRAADEVEIEGSFYCKGSVGDTIESQLEPLLVQITGAESMFHFEADIIVRMLGPNFMSSVPYTAVPKGFFDNDTRIAELIKEITAGPIKEIKALIPANTQVRNYIISRLEEAELYML